MEEFYNILRAHWAEAENSGTIERSDSIQSDGYSDTPLTDLDGEEGAEEEEATEQAITETIVIQDSQYSEDSQEPFGYEDSQPPQSLLDESQAAELEPSKQEEVEKVNSMPPPPVPKKGPSLNLAGVRVQLPATPMPDEVAKYATLAKARVAQLQYLGGLRVLKKNM